MPIMPQAALFNAQYMAASVSWGVLSMGSYRAPLKGLGVDIRQVKRCSDHTNYTAASIKGFWAPCRVPFGFIEGKFRVVRLV